jgi:predicted ATPase
VTFLVGENGSGKSTLIEALAMAWGFNAEGGSTNVNFSTRASHSSLSQYIRRVRGALRPIDGYFLRAESFFNVASYIEEIGVSGYGRTPLHEQSHGEAFFALFDNRFRGARKVAPFLVMLSSHHLRGIDEIIVAPVVNDATETVSDLESWLRSRANA